MLRALIVEDDVAMRTNLKTLINWDKAGFVVEDEAFNGVEAVQKLATRQFDLVLTDMNMPMMDGVTLIRSIREYYPETEVIVISAYDDYHYVRDSLKDGAVDYLLKHRLDGQHLYAVLQTARERVLERKNLAQKEKLHQEQMTEGRAVLIQNLILSMLNGRIDENGIQERCRMLGLPFKANHLLCCVLQIDDYGRLSGREPDLLVQSLINIVQEILQETYVPLVADLKEGRFVVLVDLGKSASLLIVHENVIKALGRIQSSAKRYLGITVTVAVSSICEACEQIPDRFQKACKALESVFYAGKEQIVWSGVAPQRPVTNLSLTIPEEEQFRGLLKLRDRSGIDFFLSGLFEKCFSENASPQSVQMICAELASMGASVCKEYGLRELQKDFNTAVYLPLGKSETFPELKARLHRQFDALLDELRRNGAPSSSNEYIRKAMEFLGTHYEQDISLSDMAEYAGVSMQYMSKLLHDECGKGFVELLNGRRVEKARAMILLRRYRLKEIAAQSGFRNYNYFFKVFKEITGVTPLRYEQEQGRQETRQHE